MKKHNLEPAKPKLQGFTIIEVVLVLAIAGLIFLMVFIALPALQRNQRDTHRKQVISMYRDAIERYKSNNKNKMPWDPIDGAGAKGGYIGSNTSIGLGAYLDRQDDSIYVKDIEFRDPSGPPYYVLVYLSESYIGTGSSDQPGRVGYSPSWRADYVRDYDRILVYVTIRRKCGANGGLEMYGGEKNYAIQIGLESGGAYCIDG